MEHGKIEGGASPQSLPMLSHLIRPVSSSVLWLLHLKNEGNGLPDYEIPTNSEIKSLRSSQ